MQEVADQLVTREYIVADPEQQVPQQAEAHDESAAPAEYNLVNTSPIPDSSPINEADITYSERILNNQTCQWNLVWRDYSRRR